MKIIPKILFLLLALFGIVLVYYISWFWRIFLIPLIILLLVDVVSSFMRTKKQS